MNQRHSSFARVIATAILCWALPSFGMPSTVSAQGEPSTFVTPGKPFWTVPTTVGFGGLGCWAGYITASEALRHNLDSDLRTPSRIVTTILGCVSGAYLGHRTGAEIDKLLGDGVELPTGLRRGAQLGTVLTGAFLVSSVALMTSGSGDGRRTRAVAYSALGGAIAGGIVQSFLNDRLEPAGTGPSVTAGPTMSGGVEVSVVFRFQ